MKKQLWLLLVFYLSALILHAQGIQGRYAIQNVKTGKNLRPFEAGKADGNRIVLYPHHSWKCMTWEFQGTQGNAYQLTNRYTQKSFQSSVKPKAGIALIQQPVKTDSSQQWEFIRQGDQGYRIRQKGTNLYVSISSDQTNSAIILEPQKNTSEQLWRLIKQDPWF